MRILIVGGAASGKSEYAELRLLSLGDYPRTYIATMEPFDDECRARVARHREMRANKGFTTVECYRGLSDIRLPRGQAVLLECVTNLLAGEMFSPKGAGEGAVDAILQGIGKLAAMAAHLVVVTGNLFEDHALYGEGTARYLKNLAAVNLRLARDFNGVTEVVCGIPIPVKEYHTAGKEA